MNSPNIKTYTIQEISKLLTIPVGTIKRWEKELDGLLIIPRTKQGARYYTNLELAKLIKVKNLRENNMNLDKIKDVLLEQQLNKREQAKKSAPTNESRYQKQAENTKQPDSKVPETCIKPESTSDQSQSVIEYETAVITNPIATEIHEGTLPNLEEFFNVMEAYKQSLLGDIKAEIRNSIRKEVIEEVKKEISKGAMQTVKTLSNSIYKLSENTKSDIQELSHVIHESAENTTENIVTLSHIITVTSDHTTESIEELSNQLHATTENASNNISTLSNLIAETKELTEESIEALASQLNTTAENTTDNLVTLSHYITSSAESTSESLESLTKKIAVSTENTNDTISTLSDGFAKVTKNTNDTFRSISNTIANSSLSTQHELSNLVDAINKDRELYLETLHEERMHFKQEIRTREAVFQDMVSNFRTTAATKEIKENKKWWKFWK